MRECPDLFPNDTSKARSLSGANFKNLNSTSFNEGISDDCIYNIYIYIITETHYTFTYLNP